MSANQNTFLVAISGVLQCNGLQPNSLLSDKTRNTLVVAAKMKLL